MWRIVGAQEIIYWWKEWSTGNWCLALLPLERWTGKPPRSPDRLRVGATPVIPRKQLKRSKCITLTVQTVSVHPQNTISKTQISITLDVDLFESQSKRVSRGEKQREREKQTPH